MSKPQPYRLEGADAPGPADFPEADEKPRKTGLATHTGTDPAGRAIGPAEDHRKLKRDIDGRTARQGPKDGDKPDAELAEAIDQATAPDPKDAPDPGPVTT